MADAFLAAPFSEDGWDKALRALASAMGSSRAHLIAMNQRHARFNWMTDAPLDYGRLFVEIEAYKPEVNYRIAAMAPPMTVSFERDYDLARRTLGTNEVYLSHVRDMDGEFGCQSVLLRNADSMVGLAMLNSARDGETSEKSRAMFARCLPHVLAAVRLQNAIDHQGAELLRGSLETMRTASVLVDGAGRVCALTPGGEEVLSTGLFTLDSGQLRAAHPGFDTLLQSALNEALSHQRRPEHDLWVPDAAPPLLVEVNPLPIRPWSLGFAPAAILTFRSPVRVDGIDGARLAQALGLTRAEGDIVAMVAMGHSRRMIAAARQTSVQTVTTQLRSIFQKCGVRREAELVGMALQLGQWLHAGTRE